MPLHSAIETALGKITENVYHFPMKTNKCVPLLEVLQQAYIELYASAHSYKLHNLFLQENNNGNRYCEHNVCDKTACR